MCSNGGVVAAAQSYCSLWVTAVSLQLSSLYSSAGTVVGCLGAQGGDPVPFCFIPSFIVHCKGVASKHACDGIKYRILQLARWLFFCVLPCLMLAYPRLLGTLLWVPAGWYPTLLWQVGRLFQGVCSSEEG
jgi:hypothetical protein